MRKQGIKYGVAALAFALAVAGVVQLACGTALTAARNTPSRTGDFVKLGVYTNTIVYAGSMVAVNSSGYLVPASDSASLNVIGMCVETVDNRTNASGAGDSGALYATVARGVFRWTNGDSFTDADIGDLAFVEDDATVQKAASASQDIIAGVVLDVDADGVWVDTYDLGAQGASVPATLAVAGAATVGSTLAVSGAATFADALIVADANGAAALTSKGFEANDATLVLDADEGDDNADTWIIESEAADNDLSIVNHTTEMAKLTSAGVLHLVNGATLDNATASTNLVITETTITLVGAVRAGVLATEADATPSRTVTSADYGKIIMVSTNGAMAITLPANGAAAGSWFDVMITGDNNTDPTISAASADTLIGANDAAADSVSFGSGHRIGAWVRFISDGAYWHVFNLGQTTMTLNT